MSRDFDKSDFQKGNGGKTCHHCGTEGGGFTLLRSNLRQVMETNNNQNYLHVQNNQIPYSHINGFDSLYDSLRTNIFTSIDEHNGTVMEKRKFWQNRLNRVHTEENEGLLEVLHFLGDKKQYNALLLSLPSEWDGQLADFINKAQPNNRTQSVENYVKQVNLQLKGGNHQHLRHTNSTSHNPNWFTDLSKEEAIPYIHSVIRSQVGGRGGAFAQEEMDNLANSIYTSLSNRGVKKFGNWEENYANNSPLSVLVPNSLKPQFNKNGIFEGLAYCNYCGTELSRSLMFSGRFTPFLGEENNTKDVVDYDGRIQDIESEVLPLIQELWKEQIDEINRRSKKATKMWDGAEDRLQKKKDAEEEAKRQAEIDKLERQLKSLKNNGE